MRHCGRRRSAVPMLLTWHKPDYIAWAEFFDWAAATLSSPKSGRNDQRLTEWMCMPGRAGPRLERDACASNTCRFGCLEQRFNAHGAGKIFGRPFDGFWWPLTCRAVALCVGGSLDFHTSLNSQLSTFPRHFVLDLHFLNSFQLDRLQFSKRKIVGETLRLPFRLRPCRLQFPLALTLRHEDLHCLRALQ